MVFRTNNGSKNAIAREIIDFLPSADTFIDVMSGGCSVAHAAMLSGKYKKVIINDIDPMPTQLFVDALNGKYKDEHRWISREDFKRLKDSDPFVRYCFSFGNNGKDYLYGKDVEEFKHGLHLAIFEKDTRLLEKELNLPSGTIPLFEGENDISRRYTLYKRYLENRGGMGSTLDCRPSNALNLSGGARLQSFEATERLGGAETSHPTAIPRSSATVRGGQDRVTISGSDKPINAMLQSYYNTERLNQCDLKR